VLLSIGAASAPPLLLAVGFEGSQQQETREAAGRALPWLCRVVTHAIQR
jgi:hypothetical protein